MDGNALLMLRHQVSCHPSPTEKYHLAVQVAEAHRESSPKKHAHEGSAEGPGSGTRDRTGSEDQDNGTGNPQHGAQQASRHSPSTSPEGKGFLGDSWIEAGDVLGAEPDSPGMHCFRFTVSSRWQQPLSITRVRGPPCPVRGEPWIG